MTIASGNTCPQHCRDFLTRLKGVSPRSWGWQATCPAHEDAHPSLSVRLGRQGQIVVKCHTGSCSPEAIVRSLGVKMDKLFPPNEENQSKRKLRFQCAYDYRDEEAELVFQVVRWMDDAGNKTFSQRKPNSAFDRDRPSSESNPEFLRGVEGCRRLLYRLPEMLADLRSHPQRNVHVVEGEKAVDYLRKKGLVATCNPMGAGPGKWLPEYSHLLAGRNVILVPDEDEPDVKTGLCVGLEHATAAAWSLYGIAASVKIVRTAPAVCDHAGLDDWWEDQDPDSMSRWKDRCVNTRAWMPLPDAPEMINRLMAEMRRQYKPVDEYAALGYIKSKTSDLTARMVMRLENSFGGEPDGISHAAIQAAAACLLAGDRS